MNIELVEKLITLVETSLLTELEYSVGGQHLKLSKLPRLPPMPDRDTAPPPAATPTPATPGLTVVPASAGPELHRIEAGLGGTFFSRPSPTEPPFVEPGTRVEEGQALGLIEAMKMLNAVEADISGIVRQVLVEDGAAVLPGAPLFLIEAC